MVKQCCDGTKVSRGGCAEVAADSDANVAMQLAKLMAKDDAELKRAAQTAEEGVTNERLLGPLHGVF